MYTPEQRKVIRKVLATGKKMGATRKEMIAAAQTGLVESGFRNLDYGDADSKGWRQERQMYYKNPTNVGASAKRYFSETKKERGNYKTPAQLAQAVQRSAFPSRYAEQSKQAKDIVKAFNAGAFGGKKMKVRPKKVRGQPRDRLTDETKTKTTTTTTATSFAPERAANRRALLTKGVEDLTATDLLAYKNTQESLKDTSSSSTDVTRRRERERVRVKPRKVRGRRRRPEGRKDTGPVQIRKDGKRGSRIAVKYAAGKTATSGERTPAQNAAVGGAAGSDHLTTKRGASAMDSKYGSGAEIAKRLGLKNWKKGTYDRHTVKLDGRKYSVQILEDVEGHYDHTHTGFQRI